MTRVPISFYLSILAGVIVLFNHCAASETGDVALNKVTGAAGRFYTLFQDTALTLHYGFTSSLEKALCDPAMNDIFPYAPVPYLRERYCRTPKRRSEGVGGLSSDQKPHGGYGSSDFAFAYYRSPMRSLAPRTSAKGSLTRSPFSFDGQSQSHLAQIVWDQSSEGVVMMAVLLLRTYTMWWWFRMPLRVTSLLLGVYSILSAIGYLFGASVVMRNLTQAYIAIMADFLQCVEWEAQRHVLDISVVTMEQIYGFVPYACKCHT